MGSNSFFNLNEIYFEVLVTLRLVGKIESAVLELTSIPPSDSLFVKGSQKLFDNLKSCERSIEVFKMKDIRNAHEKISSGQSVGKLIIDCS